MFKDIFLIALGGGVGSATRYLIGLGVATRLPTSAWMGTLTVNLVGSFLMGFLYAAARRNEAVTTSAHLMLTTGALGGFTTFSTFSLDAMRAAEAGRVGLATGYVLASVGGGLLGCALGMWTAKMAS